MCVFRCPGPGSEPLGLANAFMSELVLLREHFFNIIRQRSLVVRAWLRLVELLSLVDDTGPKGVVSIVYNCMHGPRLTSISTHNLRCLPSHHSGRRGVSWQMPSRYQMR